MAADWILGASIATLCVKAAKLTPAQALTQEQRDANQRVLFHFYVITGIELGAIFLAFVMLRVLHYPEYILSGVALIAGVHFFPLAALFHTQAYYGTALVGCAIGFLGFFIGDSLLRQKIVGISFGLMLWATAAWMVWLGFSSLPPSVEKLRPM